MTTCKLNNSVSRKVCFQLQFLNWAWLSPAFISSFGRTPRLSDAPWQDDRQNEADRGWTCQLGDSCRACLYLDVQCLFVRWSGQVRVSWRHCQPGLISGSVPVTQLTPLSCVTLSFHHTDQREDELEIAAWRPWMLRRRRGRDESGGNTHAGSDVNSCFREKKKGLAVNEFTEVLHIKKAALWTNTISDQGGQQSTTKYAR